MFRVSKVIAWVVLVCFLFNTAGSDLAFGQSLNYRSNQDKLAVPSQMDDIAGTELKDKARIKFALEDHFILLDRQGLFEGNNVNDILNKGISFKEKTVFQPVDMQIFSKVMFTEKGPCVKARLKDKSVLRDYYAVFSLKKDKFGRFPINVYTEEQYKATDGFTKGIPEVKAEDAEAINRYVQHEKIIDRFIRERIDAGDFAEMHNFAIEPLEVVKLPNRKTPELYFENILTHVHRGLGEFLNIFNIGAFDVFDGKNVVFIKVPKGINYPVIIENGRDITVKSHTSENAIYFFLNENLFDSIKETKTEQIQRNRIIRGISLETIVHEISVPYKLPYEVTRDGRIINDLGRAYELYKTGAPADEILAKYPSLKNLKKANLNHVKGRDYAAGKGNEAFSLEGLSYSDVLNKIIDHFHSDNKENTIHNEILKFIARQKEDASLKEFVVELLNRTADEYRRLIAKTGLEHLRLIHTFINGLDNTIDIQGGRCDVFAIYTNHKGQKCTKRFYSSCDYLAERIIANAKTLYPQEGAVNPPQAAVRGAGKGKDRSSKADIRPIITIKQDLEERQRDDVGIHVIAGVKGGSFTAIGVGKNYVDIVDSKAWGDIRRLRVPDWGIWAIDSSPEFLAIGGTTGELRIYSIADLTDYHKSDLQPLAKIQIASENLKIEKINAIRFLGGEKQQHIAVGYKAGEGYKSGIVILEKTGEQWKIIARFEDYNGEDNSLDSFGELFAYGTKKGVIVRRIGIWNEYKNISLDAEDGDLVAPVRFLNNGKYIMGGTTGGEVILWRMTDTLVLLLRRSRYTNGKIRSLVPSPDERHLLITCGSHNDLSKSSDIIIADIGSGILGDKVAETKGHNDIVYGALWLDNETFVTAAGFFDKYLRKWKIVETPLSPPVVGTEAQSASRKTIETTPQKSVEPILVEDMRVALTFNEHEKLRKWLKEHNGRHEKYRRRDLEPKYGEVEIYIISDLPVGGHYAIRDEIVYVSDEKYLDHEVYELLSILKYGYEKFPVYNSEYLDKMYDYVLKPGDLNSLLSWFTREEVKGVRLLVWRNEAKNKLIEWLDKTGDDLEVLKVLADIHNRAPEVPGVKMETMIEYYSNDLRLPHLALAILEAFKDIGDDYILTNAQGLKTAILELKKRDLFAQSDLLLGKDDSLLTQLSKYYSWTAFCFFKKDSTSNTQKGRNYLLKNLKSILSKPFDDADRIAVRGAAGKGKAVGWMTLDEATDVINRATRIARDRGKEAIIEALSDVEDRLTKLIEDQGDAALISEEELLKMRPDSNSSASLTVGWYIGEALNERAAASQTIPAKEVAVPSDVAKSAPAALNTATIGREPSQYGPHPSQEALRPLYEKIVWARKHATDDFKIKRIYAFKDQKHGMEPKDAISFGIVLENNKVIITDAPVMGGISAGGLEPRTHADIKTAIKFFNDNVASKFIGLNIARPDEITNKIIEKDEEFRKAASDKTYPRFSYIGAELAVGISMVSTIALAEALHVPVEVVINYRYNEYVLSHGLAKEPRPMSIPVNYSVVWEGGKHGVAKYLRELVEEGVIKDDTRFPAKFKNKALIAKKDKTILLAMVPPQELQIIVFAPAWKEAERIGIKLTKRYQELLKVNGIKTKYGAESGFTTEQVHTADGRLITTELVLDILEQATDLLPLDEAKYVRYADDLAASEFYIPEIDMYYISPAAAATIPGISEQGKKDGLVTNAEFTQYKLARYKKHPRFISCEDWAHEDMIGHWEDAKQIMPFMIQMGDDNNVSRADLIRKFKDVQNAHLHKPNQISEEGASMESVGTSHNLGNVVVWSHRGTRSPQEKYTAWGAIGTGSFGGKWTLLGPGRSALIAAMTQADIMYGEVYDMDIPYQGALVLDPNGPYKDYGWANRVRKEIAAASESAAKGASATSDGEARSLDADSSQNSTVQKSSNLPVQKTRNMEIIREEVKNLTIRLAERAKHSKVILDKTGGIQMPATSTSTRISPYGEGVALSISEHKAKEGIGWKDIEFPQYTTKEQMENVLLEAVGGETAGQSDVAKSAPDAQILGEQETAAMSATATVSSILQEIMKSVPTDWLSFMDYSKFAQVIKAAGCKADIVNDDGRAGFIFSTIAAFGEYKEGKYEEGIGPYLPELVRKGIRIAVVTENDRQEEFIKGLNKYIPDANNHIKFGRGIDYVKSELKAPRYYYLKVKHEDSVAGVAENIDIVVQYIIDAIGEILGITKKMKERAEMHEAARRFAEAA